MKIKLRPIQAMQVQTCLLPRSILITGGAKVECKRKNGAERCVIRHGSSKRILRRNLTRARADEVAARMRSRSASKATRGCERTGVCRTVPSICTPGQSPRRRTR